MLSAPKNTEIHPSDWTSKEKSVQSETVFPLTPKLKRTYGSSPELTVNQTEWTPKQNSVYMNQTEFRLYEPNGGRTIRPGTIRPIFFQNLTYTNLT